MYIFIKKLGINKNTLRLNIMGFPQKSNYILLTYHHILLFQNHILLKQFNHF